jgi:glycosyltransferase involved in cell wall biosynthesis
VAHFPTLPPAPWARPGGALVYTLHDLTWWRWRETASRMGRHYYARLADRTARRGAHIVVDTRAVRDEVVEHFGLDPSDVTVVPLGVELPEPSELPRRPRPYLLSVGTLEPRKNMTRLAEAYRRSGVAATHDLLVVGRLGWGDLPAGLEVLSGLSDGQLAATYAGATALVLPSLYEGFGLPAVEAMQLGVPVICSDIDVLREVTGGRATFVDATDLDCLVAALRAAPEACAPEGAADWARKTYRWDLTVEHLSRLYRSLDPEVTP